MKTQVIAGYTAVVCIMSLFAAADVAGQSTQDQSLQKAEARLRAIYDRGEFRAKGFNAQWLPDGSAYTVQEQLPGVKQKAPVRYETQSGKRTKLDLAEEAKQRQSGNVSPDGKTTVDNEKGNLYVRDVQSKQDTALTRNPVKTSISNQDPVWSPDSQWIAFIQTDTSNVRKRSVLVPDDPSYPTVKEVQFARVGEVLPSLRIGVVDIHGSETRWLAIPSPTEGFYLGQVSWAGNSHEVLVEQLSRFRDKRTFFLVNIETGQVTRIFHESDPAWVVASYHKNLGLEWIRDGKAFIVLSEKDGWRHAYVYSRSGKELALLTPGDFDIIERGFVDETRGWFYYYASPDNGTQKYLYRVNIDGVPKPQRVTPKTQPGTHDYQPSPDGQWAFHTYSTFDVPPVTDLVRLSDHKVLRTLEDNQALRKKMTSVITQPTEFLQIHYGDNVVADAWMIKPPDFDPANKYPVFIYVYGEPHAQTVLDAWGRSQADYHRMIADLGYVVVSIDNRGTPAPKGAAWRRCIFGRLGPLSTEEQAAAIQELGRTRSYVDLSRVGIWGWSGGGSNTLNALFRKPDVYQVGIAVVAKPQPHLYNAWFQEIYMETPDTNPEGYRRSAPINFAEGLKGDLLIIHGGGETNTHLQIMEGLVDRLIELGKPFQYMVYPNRNHGLREGKGTNVHLRMHMARYLMEHLPAGPQ